MLIRGRCYLLLGGPSYLTIERRFDQDVGSRVSAVTPIHFVTKVLAQRSDSGILPPLSFNRDEFKARIASFAAVRISEIVRYLLYKYFSGQSGSIFPMTVTGDFFFFFMHFFSGTKHPREDNPNLYYWAEMTGLHTQTFNI